MMFANGMRGFGNFANNPCFGYGGMGHDGGIFMMFFGLLIIVLIGYAIYKASNKGRMPIGFGPETSNEALDILKLKFVNGEITEEEYLRKRNLLLK